MEQGVEKPTARGFDGAEPRDEAIAEGHEFVDPGHDSALFGEGWERYEEI